MELLYNKLQTKKLKIEINFHLLETHQHKV
jgi:hypothetical protein